MPCVRIATGKWGVDSEIKLIGAVESALVSAFKITERHRTSWSISMTRPAARSLSAKCKLFRTIADDLEAAGVPRRETSMFLIEAPAESWGIRGGLFACEADLGFNIDV
jgi:hypothetical protein